MDNLETDVSYDYWVVEHVGASPEERWLKKPPAFLRTHDGAPHPETFVCFEEAYKFGSSRTAHDAVDRCDLACVVHFYDNSADSLSMERFHPRSPFPGDEKEYDPAGLPPPYHSGPGMFGNAWPLSER